MRTFVFLLLALVLGMGLTDGATTVGYAGPSQIVLHEVSTPLRFFAGNNTNVSQGQTSTTYSSLGVNKTTFTMSLTGPKSKTTSFVDIGRATHTVASATKVTYAAAQDTNAQITAFTLTFRAGGVTLGILDLKAASPTITFTMPAGAQTLYVDTSMTTGSSGAQTGSVTVTARFAP